MPTIEQARAWYIDSDPVHDFEHVMRVYRTAEKLAKQEGGDLAVIRAAVLLHDTIGSTPGSDARTSHHEQSADFAGQVLAAEGWPARQIEAVQHCIRAHRFRGSEMPATLEAQILFDADKLDVLGAIGVVRVVAYAALNGQPAYAQPSEQFLQTGAHAPGEPHSAYHEYLFKLRKIKNRLFTSTARAMAEQREQYLTEFFQQLSEEIAGNK